MAVKIRLQRKGKKNQPFYHIVVADARSPRDGRSIERIGAYNPHTVPATIEVDRQRAYDWLQKGAQPTDTVRAMLRFKGVYYLRHLMRGVQKGALTEEQAEQMHREWIDAKERKIVQRSAEWLAKIAAENARIAGLDISPESVKKHVPKVEIAPQPEAGVPAAGEVVPQEVAVEETTAEARAEEPAAEAPVAEATPVAEEPAAEEVAVDDAPSEEEK